MQEQQCKTVDTVSGFDLETYASRPWYIHQQAEIEYAPLEQNFCVKAEYTIRNSHTFWGYSVDVLNYAQDVNGAEFGGPLCAFQEKENLSKLNVAPCFLPKIFSGPYWVVAYDEDQGYALISGGQPTIPSGDGCKTGDGVNGSGLWIFSRSPTRDESLISTVRAIAQDKGFDLSVLNDVQQEECVYPSEEEDEVEEGTTTTDCPEDPKDTFGTIFSGQKDCEWVGDWNSVRCLLYGGKCPATCGKDASCPN